MSDHTKGMPEGYHAITPADKLKIQEFGRELTTFINKYANDHQEGGQFPYRIILGGFDYHAQLTQEIAKAAMEDLIVMQGLASEVGARIDEPFSPNPVAVPPTPVESASISPNDAVPATAPMEPSVEAPVAVPEEPGTADVTPEPAVSVDPEPVAPVAPATQDTEAPADGSFDPTLVS